MCNIELIFVLFQKMQLPKKTKTRLLFKKRNQTICFRSSKQNAVIIRSKLLVGGKKPSQHINSRVKQVKSISRGL